MYKILNKNDINLYFKNVNKKNKYIKCLNASSLNLIKLPNLSYLINLTEFNCFNNNLSILPILPVNLEKLDCSYNKLEQIINLPINLKVLSCNRTYISKFPELPFSLKKFICFSNSLLLTLPRSIVYCKNNYYYKKYNQYYYLQELTYLLNYKIENYYYKNIINHYNISYSII